MTHKQLTQLVDAILLRVREYTADQLVGRDRRQESSDQLIANLEERISSLESKRAVGDE